MTASVDPRGCVASRFTPEFRERQYESALQFYLRVLQKNHSFAFRKIVFVENSGWNLNRLMAVVPDAYKSCVEFLSIPIDDFIPARGKSYNEMLLINKACASSAFLGDPATRFVKVTGRYPILNILAMFRNIAQNESADCFFQLHSTKPLVDTRCIMFTKKVWMRCFEKQYLRADNKTGWHFENLVYDVVVRDRKQLNLCFFRLPFFITGLQGGARKVLGVKVPDILTPCYLVSIFVYHVANRVLGRDKKLLAHMIEKNA